MDELLPATVAEVEHDGSLDSENLFPTPAVAPPSMGLHDLPEEMRNKLVGKTVSVNRVQHSL